MVPGFLFVIYLISNVFDSVLVCLPVFCFIEILYKDMVFLLAEFMHGGSLYDYLHKNHNVLKLPQLLKFAIDVCKGMEYLHQNNIIHRDLKTANLLMDTQNVRVFILID